MALARHQILDYEVGRDTIRSKKMKPRKIDKKLLNAFMKLNRKDCYGFIEDKGSKTYQNALDFFTLLEKRLELDYGKKKKYKKEDVQASLETVLSGLTERGCKTIRALDKALKKGTEEEFAQFPFNGLIKGKTFHSLRAQSSDDQSLTYEESVEYYKDQPKINWDDLKEW